MSKFEVLERVWNHEDMPSDEEFEAAARVLYENTLHTNALAQGDEGWSPDPELVCHLGLVVPVRVLMEEGEEDESFHFYLKRAFKKKTELEWDTDKHVLVSVPNQILGNPHFVVFDRSHDKE